MDRDDCINIYIDHERLPSIIRYYVEHLVEGQMIRDFMQDVVAGRLLSGATARTGRISASLFRIAQTMPLPLPLLCLEIIQNLDYGIVLWIILEA